MKDIQIQNFFGAAPQALPLFEAVSDKIFGRFPSVSLNVLSTQISFDDPHSFAYVWLPPGKVKGRPENYIVLSFVLPREIKSPKITQATFIRQDRITHHVLIHAGQLVDDEMLCWLKEAHALMCTIRHR